MLRYLPLSVFALAVASGFMTTTVEREVHTKVIDSGINIHETHASASLLGQFRTSISSWLWLRTDLYLHNGVEMRPLTDQEVDQGRQAATSADDFLREGLTVIPGAERDFRGVFGDIERSTHAYKNMEGHTHNSPLRAMPLYRLMTWIEPTFEEGWRTGGAVLGMGADAGRADQAIAFLTEGLTANPQSLMILNQLGFTWAVRKRDFPRAIVYFERARSTAKQAKNLSEPDKESLLDVYRWLTLLYRETDQPDKQAAIAAEGLKVFPGDVVLMGKAAGIHEDHGHETHGHQQRP
ncbi:MAG: hypothetical protein IT206_04840 [Fimbriimonadaceae bacterium]|nr:hypothetical protein [Fimbriimonadaceae bacterium]